MNVLDALRGGLVVSSQVMDPRSPLSDPETLARLAEAAGLGGAAGFRVDGPDVVAALRRRTRLPIIGIRKRRDEDSDSYITTSITDALELVSAGAEIVAAQATAGSRPHESFEAIASAVHKAGGLVMADISTLAEAEDAMSAGADLVATTLLGFTPDTKGAARPPFELVRVLSERLAVPVVLEGGIWTPEHVRGAFDAGAFLVVAGSAVTAPDLIARRLAGAAPRALT